MHKKLNGGQPSAEQRATAVWLKLRKDPGIPAIAAELGITRQAVQQWRKVPDRHIPAVAALTNIPARKLRPDLAKLLRG